MIHFFIRFKNYSIELTLSKEGLLGLTNGVALRKLSSITI